MASTTRINITATPKKNETITLLGKQYSVRPPKTALLMALQRHNSKSGSDPDAVINDFDTIVKLIFGSKAPEVQKRLDDPEDDLDIDHILEVVDALTGDATGNPTS